MYFNAGVVAVNSEVSGLPPGANSTIASYNARVVNFYNAAGSLACFVNKNILFYFEKRSSLIQSRRCSYSKVVGSAPELKVTRNKPSIH
jgi:hypothetical protein